MGSPVSVSVKVEGGAVNVSGAGDIVRNRRGLNAALGARLEELLFEHFRAKNARGNKRGWPRSNFWLDVARSTQLLKVDEEGAVVQVGDSRFPIHVYGKKGLKPKQAPVLTIPLHPMAKGKFVKDLRAEGVEIFQPKKKGGGGLANILATKVSGVMVPLYALKDSVDIPKDPDALPRDAEIEDALAEEVNDYLDREIAKLEGGQA